MDIILYNIIAAIVCLIFGYLLGSVEFSIIIGKVFFHQDPREYGSKNAGGTNAGRLWGKKVGFTVIVLDMIKTIIPMWICWAVLTFAPLDGGEKALMVDTISSFDPELCATFKIQWPVYLLANLGAAIGHCWPIFDHFKGGKGVSAYMGTLLSASWGVGFLPAGIFYFPILKKTKYVSFTSICMGILGPVCAWTWYILVATGVIPHGYEWIVGYGPSINVANYTYAITITLMSILMIARHHANIKRLMNGTERKIKWMGGDKKKEEKPVEEAPAK